MNLRRLPMLLLRDGLVLAATAALWTATLRAGAAGGFAIGALHVLTALATVVCGFLLHEWGHLLGALAAGSAVVLPKRWAYLFLFQFDSGRNDRRQFLWMSLGGFIASILVVAALVVALPYALLASKLALALVGLGVLATLIIEVPEAWRVARGAPLPNVGAVYVSGTGGESA